MTRAEVYKIINSKERSRIKRQLKKYGTVDTMNWEVMQEFLLTNKYNIDVLEFGVCRIAIKEAVAYV